MLKEKKDENAQKLKLNPEEKQSFIKFIYKYLSNFHNLIEVLNLIRPLVYLGLVIYFKQKSYLPLIASLIIDIIILKYYRKEDKFIHQKIFSFEYNRRYIGIFLYFLREPIFSNFTKPFLKGFLSKIWMSQWIIDLLLNLLSYFTNCYYIL